MHKTIEQHLPHQALLLQPQAQQVSVGNPIREEKSHHVENRPTLSKKISSYSMNGSEPDISSEKKTFETLTIPAENYPGKPLSGSPKPIISPMETPREKKESLNDTPRKFSRGIEIYKRMFCFGTAGDFHKRKNTYFINLSI